MLLQGKYIGRMLRNTHNTHTHVYTHKCNHKQQSAENTSRYCLSYRTLRTRLQDFFMVSYDDNRYSLAELTAFVIIADTCNSATTHNFRGHFYNSCSMMMMMNMRREILLRKRGDNVIY